MMADRSVCCLIRSSLLRALFVLIGLLGVAGRSHAQSEVRCTKSGPGTLCLRLLADAGNGRARAVTAYLDMTQEIVQHPTLKVVLDGGGTLLKLITTEAVAKQPLPLDVVLVVQANEFYAHRDSVASLQELVKGIDTVLPQTRVGLLIYHRRKQKESVALDRPRTEVVLALSRLQTRPVVAEEETPPFSASDALDSALELMTDWTSNRPKQRLVIMASDGEDENERTTSNEIFSRHTARAVRLGVTVDVLWRHETRKEPWSYLTGICNKTGGLVWVSRPTANFPMLVRRYARQALQQQQAVDMTLNRPSAMPASGGHSQQGIQLSLEGSADPPLKQSLDLTWPAEGISPPVLGGDPLPARRTPLWLWGTIWALLALVCCVPLLLRSVREALKLAVDFQTESTSPVAVLSASPTVKLPAFPAVGGLGLVSERIDTLVPTTKARPQKSQPKPARAVIWYGQFNRGQRELAWLVSVESGKCYLLDRPDISLGNDPSADIVVPGAKLEPFGCRLVRDPQTQRMALYPILPRCVEYQGQFLTQAVYLSDKDHLSIGPHTYIYFETVVTSPRVDDALAEKR